MQFRPVIDIHNGKVKQIVGSTLANQAEGVKENFVSEKSATYYALLYKKYGLKGGHMIMLNSVSDPYFAVTQMEALDALNAYPGGLQIGGGITAENAKNYIDAGASHVVVTSYAFTDGSVNFDHLENLVDAVGRNHIVLDLSAKRFNEGYAVMLDRWQTKSNEILNVKLLERLENYCAEFLIHAIDVEGMRRGIEQNLVKTLVDYDGVPVTYAGGVSTLEDLKILRKIGNDKINGSAGSALDIYGGKLEFKKVITEFNS